MTINQQDVPDSLLESVEKHSLVPLWEIYKNLVKTEPTPSCEATIWHYTDVRPLLARAGEEISTEEAERRVLLFKNPSLAQPFTTNTLACGLQLLKEGEIESKHRHTQAALRLVVEGSGGYTTTDGERVWMNPGDLITTPSWTWHDHAKESAGSLVWLDGIDVPLINFLQVNFSEFGSENEPQQILTKPDGDSHYRYGSGLMPIDHQRSGPHSPIYSYPYERTREVLENLKRNSDWDDWHGIKMKFSNPRDGGHLMPTIAAFMQLLPAGFKTKKYRSTDATIVSVVEGSGVLEINGEEIPWRKSDVFVIPNWTWHSLKSDSEAVLFSFSDRAMQERLCLWRDQKSA